MYDLFLIQQKISFPDNIKHVFKKILEVDQVQFGNRHIEFKESPEKELLYGLKALHQNPRYEKRFHDFLDAMVYHPNPPTWKEGLTCVTNLFEYLTSR